MTRWVCSSGSPSREVRWSNPTANSPWPDIRQIAAYEPALLMDATRYTGWVARFDREMVRGKVAAAEITSMYGLDLAPPSFKLMGRRLAEALTDRAMEAQDKKASSDTVTIRKLAPTLRWEGLLLAETAGTIAAFAEVPAQVLLLAGTMKRPAFIRPAFDAFARTLPHARCVRFPGLDHGGSGDPVLLHPTMTDTAAPAPDRPELPPPRRPTTAWPGCGGRSRCCGRAPAATGRRSGATTPRLAARTAWGPSRSPSAPTWRCWSPRRSRPR
jgi:hypothetical protein